MNHYRLNDTKDQIGSVTPSTAQRLHTVTERLVSWHLDIHLAKLDFCDGFPYQHTMRWGPVSLVVGSFGRIDINYCRWFTTWEFYSQRLIQSKPQKYTGCSCMNDRLFLYEWPVKNDIDLTLLEFACAFPNGKTTGIVHDTCFLCFE